MTSSNALEAGRTAAAAMRWAEAHEQLSTADSLGCLGGPDLELLAEVALLRGEAPDAVDVLVRAYESHLAAGDGRSAARAACWLSLWLIELGDFTRCVAWASRAMHIVGAMDDPGSLAGLVRLPPAVAQLGSGDPAEARRIASEVVELGERTGDRELVANASLCLGKSLIELGELTGGFGCFDRAMAAVDAREVNPVAAGIVACAVVSDAIMASDTERATAWVEVLDDWCRRQPELVTFTGQRHALRAALLIARGSWPEAATAAELALARFRAGDFRAVHGAPYQHAELARLRGAFRSAEASYGKAAESGWEPQPGLALLRLAEGRVRQAQVEIRRTIAGSDSFTRRFLLPAVVEIEVAGGDVAAARAALEELRDSSTRMSTPTLRAVLAAAEARVLLAEGDAAAALGAARDAVERWRVIGAPYEHARSRVLAGRALLSLGDRVAAEADLGAARTAFLELGAHPALAELAGVGAAGTARRAGALTAREVEVLRLVSTGLTNRAVGERLSLSEKTVARHLSNIFGKLGLSSRAGATAWAYENGLV